MQLSRLEQPLLRSQRVPFLSPPSKGSDAPRDASKARELRRWRPPARQAVATASCAELGQEVHVSGGNVRVLQQAPGACRGTVSIDPSPAGRRVLAGACTELCITCQVNASRLRLAARSVSQTGCQTDTTPGVPLTPPRCRADTHPLSG